MKKLLKNIAGRIQKQAGHSAACVWLAGKVRNQCMGVIKASLNDGIDPLSNGEDMLVSHLAPASKVFIDVGANVGNWARRFANLMEMPKFGILVEPNPTALQYLERTVSGFPCQVHVLEAAVSLASGTVLFYSEPDAGETSSLVQGFSSKSANAINVEVTTIDQIMEDFAIQKCDFLKIDAEGYDLKVIKGAVRSLESQRIEVLQFEYNAPWATAGSTLVEAIDFLDHKGYEVFLLLKDGLHRLEYEDYGEYFGYSNFVAVRRNAITQLSALLVTKP